jgi:ribosomal protein L3 glutamine methyltransferase
LTPEGHLIVEIGTGQEALENTRPDLPFLWLDTEASTGEVFALTAADLKAKRGESTRRDRKRR